MSEYIDMGGISHRIASFDKRHGASVVFQGWILFEDGAYREANIMGAMHDPPTDRHELAKRKALYHKIILDAAMKAFDRAKHSLRVMAQNNLNAAVCGPTPSVAEATAELKGLKAVALAAKAKHDKALAAVEAAKPESMREDERMNIQNQEYNAQLLAAIERIEL